MNGQKSPNDCSNPSTYALQQGLMNTQVYNIKMSVLYVHAQNNVQ